ncbi:hypothetical protein BDF14DRAFT_1996626 [Spinellus fusiger]|nr:hypothetical protein BDF14DRAFT_1996626 [Spinellus fusiger]
MLLLDMNTIEKHEKKPKQKKVTKNNIKAVSKERTSQQNDMEALQITFYEIEAWIDKTTPTMNRMIKELDKASVQFDKRRRIESGINNSKEESSTALPDSNKIKWTLSFQPGSALRLETNITSIEQLITAVQKIQLMSDPEMDETTKEDEDDPIPVQENDVDQDSTDYWSIVTLKKPKSCLEKYKHDDENFSRLTGGVTPAALNHICNIYWNCMHPKLSININTFWNRSSEPSLNQVFTDSALALVFLHGLRHQKNVCANSQDISFFYYDRAKEYITDFFDAPNATVVEALLNLSMFCTLCKRHSQSRTYVNLAMRMMVEMGIHKKASLPKDPLERKKYLELFMVLYYNDVHSHIYSGERAQVEDKDWDVDLSEIIDINQKLLEDSVIDPKSVVKSKFFVCLLELIKINKQIETLKRDYRQFSHHTLPNELPPRWSKRSNAIETALVECLCRLKQHYNIDLLNAEKSYYANEHSNYYADGCTMPVEIESLREQTELMLMMYYQAQWTTLHKIFIPYPTSSPSSSPYATPHYGVNTPGSDTTSIDCAMSDISFNSDHYSAKSYAICLDAAHRIIILAEGITVRYGWCVCQNFVHCLYQASTIYCRNIIVGDEQGKEIAETMLRRVMRILDTTRVQYEGLPYDLNTWLNEFLTSHGLGRNESTPLTEKTDPFSNHFTFELNDALPNSFSILTSDNLKRPIP